MEASALARTGRLGIDTHEIEDIGTITFRGMSRLELLEASRIGEQHGNAAQEKFVLAVCMIDPPMTEADVKAWQRESPAGEIAPITKKINKLSGLGKDAAKSEVPSDGAGPDAGV